MARIRIVVAPISEKIPHRGTWRKIAKVSWNVRIVPFSQSAFYLSSSGTNWIPFEGMIEMFSLRNLSPLYL